MKRKAIPIVIPHYQEPLDQVLELLDSIETYFSAPFQVIIVDVHSPDGSYERLLALSEKKDNLVILRNSKRHGWGWGMWHNTGVGFKWAWENLDFEFALRVDCDALVVNKNIDTLLAELYKDKRIGLAGQTATLHKKSYFSRAMGRKWKKLAEKNGYFQRFETAQNYWYLCEGCFSVSKDLIGKMVNSNTFDEVKKYGGIYSWLTGPTAITEGPILAMLCYAFGFKTIDVPLFRPQNLFEDLYAIPYEIFRPMGICAFNLQNRSKVASLEKIKAYNQTARKYFSVLRDNDRKRAS